MTVYDRMLEQINDYVEKFAAYRFYYAAWIWNEIYYELTCGESAKELQAEIEKLAENEILAKLDEAVEAFDDYMFDVDALDISEFVKKAFLPEDEDGEAKK